MSAMIARGWVHTGSGRMFHPVLRRWRNAAKYNTANDPDVRRAEQLVTELEADLDAMLADGEIPFLAGEASNDRMEVARQILRKLPRRILAQLWTSRRRIELVPGADMQHKQHGRVLGVASIRTAKIAANAEDFGLTLLHEAAHLLDNLRRWHGISNTAAWREIWAAERKAGRVPDFADQSVEPSEYFAEAFAQHWAGPTTRAKLSSRVQQFMRKLKDDPR
ncbi:MAG: hypothetical protein K8R46_10890 [Pirellulales bacterium]|nr:hypothetical protein [Pirellulales bacterium]